MSSIFLTAHIPTNTHRILLSTKIFQSKKSRNLFHDALLGCTGALLKDKFSTKWSMTNSCGCESFTFPCKFNWSWSVCVLLSYTWWILPQQDMTFLFGFSAPVHWRLLDFVSAHRFLPYSLPSSSPPSSSPLAEIRRYHWPNLRTYALCILMPELYDASWILQPATNPSGGPELDRHLSIPMSTKIYQSESLKTCRIECQTGCQIELQMESEKMDQFECWTILVCTTCRLCLGVFPSCYLVS